MSQSSSTVPFVNQPTLVVLDVSGLYAIGGLLLVILGLSTVFLRKKDSAWNIQLAALMVAWILISKGLQALIRLFHTTGNADVSVIGFGGQYLDGRTANLGVASTEASSYFTEVLVSMNIMLNFLFISLSALLTLIFPINFLNRKMISKLFASIILISTLFFALVLAFYPEINMIEGMVNDPPAAIIWGVIYLYSVFNRDTENELWDRIADICALLMTTILGSYFFHWMGIMLLSDYYLSSGLSGTETTLAFYLPQLSMAFSLFAFAILVVGESYRSWRKEPRLVSYIIGLYFVIGVLSHAILSLGSDSLTNLQSVDTGENMVIQTWQTFTSLFHFYIGRPLLLMILLFKFNLVDTESAERSSLSRITIMLVVVTAATGVMEMLQEIMPIPQVFSAVILGIALAFAIGWEERIFDWLTKEQYEIADPFSDLRERKLEMGDNSMVSFQRSMVGCLILVFFSSMVIAFGRVL